MRTIWFSPALIMVLLFCAATARSAEPLETAFTYQGELVQSGQPANGSFDLQFELYDADSLGTSMALPIVLEDVVVQDGLFTVQVDFGGVAFLGDRAWMEIAVREGSSTGGFTGLLPRQEVTPAPYALHALHADRVAASAVGTVELVDGSVGRSDIDTNEVQRRVSGICAAGSSIRYIHADGSVACDTPPVRPIFRVTGRGFAVKTIPASESLEVDIWEVVRTNVGNAFNATTRRFVAPRRGLYYLHAVVDQANAGTESLFSITFNTGLQDQFVRGNHPLAEISGIYELTAGQQVYVYLRNYGTTETRVDGADSLFEGFLIE